VVLPLKHLQAVLEEKAFPSARSDPRQAVGVVEEAVLCSLVVILLQLCPVLSLESCQLLHWSLKKG
jgi:hypothetical protein